MQAEFTIRSSCEKVQLALTQCFTQSTTPLYKVTVTFLIAPQMRIWRSLSPNSERKRSEKYKEKRDFLNGRVVRTEIGVTRSREARNSKQTAYRYQLPTRSEDEP